MNCPYCDSDLEDEGPWGLLALHQTGEVFGRIYKCENRDGFMDEETANEYLKLNEQTLENLGLSTWEELTCDSSMHSVSGSFYTDSSDNLCFGYPC